MLGDVIMPNIRFGLYTVFNATTQFNLIVKLYTLMFMFNCSPYGLTKLSSYTLLLNLKEKGYENGRRRGIGESRIGGTRN